MQTTVIEIGRNLQLTIVFVVVVGLELVSLVLSAWASSRPAPEGLPPLYKDLNARWVRVQRHWHRRQWFKAGGQAAIAFVRWKLNFPVGRVDLALIGLLVMLAGVLFAPGIWDAVLWVLPRIWP